MKRWEYMILKGVTRANLHDYGMKGWELITVTTNHSNLLTYYFKRELFQ